MQTRRARARWANVLDTFCDDAWEYTLTRMYIVEDVLRLRAVSKTLASLVNSALLLRIRERYPSVPRGHIADLSLFEYRHRGVAFDSITGCGKRILCVRHAMPFTLLVGRQRQPQLEDDVYISRIHMKVTLTEQPSMSSHRCALWHVAKIQVIGLNGLSVRNASRWHKKRHFEAGDTLDVMIGDVIYIGESKFVVRFLFPSEA